MNDFVILGNLFDVHRRCSYPARIVVSEGLITAIERLESYRVDQTRIILPGFIDAHVHVESSMLSPCEFARQVVRFGTIATVNDPHEIANVCGVAGVEWMLRCAEKTPFRFCFGVPSCVPALGGAFETAGAVLGADEVRQMLANPRLEYLAEFMNFPGVLAGFPEVMEKLQAAKDCGKLIDGHAPGIRGSAAVKYCAAGPSTDHECNNLAEALDKLAAGMKILIREGSAARDFAALHSLLGSHPERVMFCSDDLHPDLLMQRHIDGLVRDSVQLGYDPYDVLRAASINPNEHYQLGMGMLRVGDRADFIVAKGPLESLTVLATYIKGELVAENGRSLIPRVDGIAPINNFSALPIEASALAVPMEGSQIRVIEVTDGQIATKYTERKPIASNGHAVACADAGLMKLVVLNRYQLQAKPAIGFVEGFCLRGGAMASSVGHDCHNIVAIGDNDEDLARVINELVRLQGGLAVCAGEEMLSLPLEVAGLVSLEPAEVVAERYIELDRFSKQLGCSFQAGFMTLSFLALPVIPELKLTDRGLIDGRSMKLVPLFVD